MGRRRHFPLMLLLTGLFALRVAAQLVQAVHQVSFLPSFEAWQGSNIPYPALLGLQACIVCVLVVVLWRVKADAIAPRPWKHQACFALGGLYFALMAFRLIAGLTFLTEYAWFAKRENCKTKDLGDDMTYSARVATKSVSGPTP